MPSFIGYVPTQTEFIRGFFDLAPVTSSDVVYDLGSGDGRVLFHALEKGAGKVVGVELNPELVQESKKTATAKGLDDRATFLQADLMDVDLTEATVILCYLFPTASFVLKKKLSAEQGRGQGWSWSHSAFPTGYPREPSTSPADGFTSTTCPRFARRTPPSCCMPRLRPTEKESARWNESFRAGCPRRFALSLAAGYNALFVSCGIAIYN
jgi:hypothetical protein